MQDCMRNLKEMPVDGDRDFFFFDILRYKTILEILEMTSCPLILPFWIRICSKDSVTLMETHE